MKEYLTFQDLIGYELAGITEISANTPVDRFPKDVEIHKQTEGFPIDGEMNFDAIKTIEDLEYAVKQFDKCSLKKTAMNTVFASGIPTANIMIIGDVPAGEEDKQGIPFVGENGELLDKMLASIGLYRDKNCYITNLIPWRPPGNRAPSQSEINLCLPFLKKHIELISPDIILCLGAVSLNALLGTNHTINKGHGNWAEYHISGNGKTSKIIATYHPGFLLRSPGQKKNAWADLLKLKKEIK